MEVQKEKVVCPKCGRIGTQVAGLNDGKYRYYRVVHNHKEQCYIGRNPVTQIIGREMSTEEFFGTLNRPTTIEAKAKAFDEWAEQLSDLVGHYRPILAKATSGSVQALMARLESLLISYGYEAKSD